MAIGLLRTLGTAALFVLITLAGAPSAHAVDRHEAVKLTAVKKGKKTVGFKVTMRLRPDIHDTVRIGIGSAGKFASAEINATTKREAASGSYGYIRAKLGELKGLRQEQAKEVSYTVLYGKGNDLGPGETVDVVTAWKSSRKDRQWHVFGMVDGPMVDGEKFTLPK